MKRSPLHPDQTALGAHFTTNGEWEMPAHFGDPQAEHLAVRNGVGIADLSLRGTVRVTGEDRVTWLQSIISNDLLPLQPGHGLYSTFMNHKGKILSYFRVYRFEDSLFLEDMGEIGETTYQTLRKFLLFGTKAKMENGLERWGMLLVCGPQACQLLNAAFGLDLKNLQPLDFQTIDGEECQGFIARTEETGEPDYEVMVPVEGLTASWKQLWTAGQPFGLRPIGTKALESLRIEAGIPKVGPDVNEHIVPPEANLEGKAFSLSKGCYPGQEVVARMDTYGTVKRRLVGLAIETPADHLPQQGAKLFSGHREVGWISSAAYSPTLNQAIAFGFPLRDFTKPGTELTVEIQDERHRAVVHTLPFLPPSLQQ